MARDGLTEEILAVLSLDLQPGQISEFLKARLESEPLDDVSCDMKIAEVEASFEQVKINSSTCTSRKQAALPQFMAGKDAIARSQSERLISERQEQYLTITKEQLKIQALEAELKTAEDINRQHGENEAEAIIIERAGDENEAEILELEIKIKNFGDAKKARQLQKQAREKEEANAKEELMLAATLAAAEKKREAEDTAERQRVKEREAERQRAKEREREAERQLAKEREDEIVAQRLQAKKRDEEVTKAMNLSKTVIEKAKADSGDGEEGCDFSGSDGNDLFGEGTQSISTSIIAKAPRLLKVTDTKLATSASSAPTSVKKRSKGSGPNIIAEEDESSRLPEPTAKKAPLAPLPVLVPYDDLKQQQGEPLAKTRRPAASSSAGGPRGVSRSRSPQNDQASSAKKQAGTAAPVKGSTPVHLKQKPKPKQDADWLFDSEDGFSF